MTLPDARIALKKFFGYDNFRPNQAEIIKSVYDQRDILVLMPTGGGKSICFQIPAITLDGVCIVVSPLISLMKDQVESLRGNGIPAAFFNSSLSQSQERQVIEDLTNEQIKLLYVSPERLLTRSFYDIMLQLNISLFAIDEAHCISSWGHDFRPEYTKMKFLKKSFPHVPIMALTATADKLTRKDIIHQMGLQNPKVFVASFDRPNLSIEVRQGQRRIQQIVNYIKQRPNQSGIIYCLSRRNTENLADKLRANGIRATHYHAGLSPNMRSEVQEDFINDRVPIVCATVAFGMGIDKSNVRYVIHYNLPKNIEGYYQEIGRAGRDGADADTLLFWSYGDIKILRDILTDPANQSDQTELKLTKLERMRHFAEAMQCRRKILLAYFGETMTENCGNCDICKNPPQRMDGTIIAQKALSALARTHEKVGMELLIHILKGSNRREIYDYGFNKIKTYGAGRDISFADWKSYMMQLLNAGLMEIAYDQRSTLKLTEDARKVLFEGKKVGLVQPIDIQTRTEAAKRKTTEKTKKERVRDDLFETLRKLRIQLARVRGIPPYLIFSDATLEEMAARRPVTDQAMNDISGVGERKMHLYGDQFKQAIIDFLRAKEAAGEKIQGNSHILSYDLYKKGFSVADIATQRNVKTITVMTHLAKAYEQGEDLNLAKFVAAEEIDLIIGALPRLESPYKLGDIFRHFNEKIPYDKIRFAMAHYYREVAV
ncbi:MAG: DNA helicase RecQ [Bacteroidota bacterium]